MICTQEVSRSELHEGIHQRSYKGEPHAGHTARHVPHARNYHDGFKRYGNSQKQMYEAIIGATKHVIKDIHPDVIVPSGTAVQNARTSSIGDNMNRDGYHLNYLYGRYTAACTWFQAIFKRNVVGNSYAPEGVTAEQKAIAQKAASAAVKHKFKVTQIK